MSAVPEERRIDRRVIKTRHRAGIEPEHPGGEYEIASLERAAYLDMRCSFAPDQKAEETA